MWGRSCSSVPVLVPFQYVPSFLQFGTPRQGTQKGEGRQSERRTDGSTLGGQPAERNTSLLLTTIKTRNQHNGFAGLTSDVIGRGRKLRKIRWCSGCGYAGLTSDANGRGRKQRKVRWCSGCGYAGLTSDAIGRGRKQRKTRSGSVRAGRGLEQRNAGQQGRWQRQGYRLWQELEQERVRER